MKCKRENLRLRREGKILRRIVMADAGKLAGVLKVLATEARLRIVQALKRQPLCVTELVSQLGISQEATSQHLRVLKDAGIVKWQKHGPFVYYHLNKEGMARLRKAIDVFFKADD